MTHFRDTEPDPDPDPDEPVDQQTGEVVGRRLDDLSTEEIIRYQPISPIELEQTIRILGDRVEASVPVLKDLLQARYDAERVYIETRAQAILDSQEEAITMRRAEADVIATPARKAFDDARTVLHAAEHLQKALTSKLMGYQNLNKVQGSAYGASGIGR